MDKLCDIHQCKMWCPKCNGKKGGENSKGSRSIRKTIACRINAQAPRPKRRKTSK